MHSVILSIVEGLTALRYWDDWKDKLVGGISVFNTTLSVFYYFLDNVFGGESLLD